MNEITGAIMVPHPPLILPRIGQGEERKIADVVKAYEEAAREIIDSRPDTVVIVSPHAPCYYDYIQLSAGKGAAGDMGQFRDPYDRFDILYDEELVDEIEKIAAREGLPAGTLGQQEQDLDHGTMIPLYFLQDLPKDTKFVRMGIGGPDHLTHYKAGMAIAQAAKNLGRKVAIVGSGDLSHCQKPGTHYGFKECGPAYDRKIMEVMGDKDFLELLEMPESLENDAMSCGHKSFCVMAGALDGLDVDARALAHSAEFGVGYGVATYTNPREDENRHFLEKAQANKKAAKEARDAKSDEYVNLARKTVEEYVRHGMVPKVSEIPEELKNQQAGAFVSIHKNGQLRGCIGTTAPTARNLGVEIMQNAVSASTKDPRFPPIADWELDDLEINVDVLKTPEKIASKDQLDVKKYGVIVSSKGRRGLLLPDLEGVDTVDDQIAIAKQKAGIAPEEDVDLERFEVVRHV